LAAVRADSVKKLVRLLAPGDPDPVVAEFAGADCPLFFVGDHSGRAIPARLGALGLQEADLQRHIAWDIGVEALGARLAAGLGADFVRQAYSRLVIDCNRAPDSTDSIPSVSDGIAVEGNFDLSIAERRARREEIYQPYQDAIAAALDQRQTKGLRTVLVALHSFTPSLAGISRPWRYGVLHRDDSPFSARVLALMRGAMGELAGDNQPYAMDGTDNTVPLHLAGRAIDYLELEVRQDLIADPPGVAERAAEISDFLGAAT
jgi:predicted N-formylglutamate amidohydrolase